MNLSRSVNFTHLPARLMLVQPVRKTASYENKLHNLRLASACINGVEVAPGQFFSFWKIVGAPDETRGFRKSRVIRNNKTDMETGGGLCQLSGIIYLLALQAGMEISERHPHSVDLYREDERFAPLGADAAVVYGYKDLRFLNNTGLTITLECIVSAGNLKLIARAGGPLKKHKVDFTRISETDNSVSIQMSRRSHPSVTISEYRKSAK